jgi:hypothetical protein
MVLQHTLGEVGRRTRIGPGGDWRLTVRDARNPMQLGILQNSIGKEDSMLGIADAFMINCRCSDE